LYSKIYTPSHSHEYRYGLPKNSNQYFLQQQTYASTKLKAEERLQEDLELRDRDGDELRGEEDERRPTKKSRAQKRKVRGHTTPHTPYHTHTHAHTHTHTHSPSHTHAYPHTHSPPQTQEKKAQKEREQEQRITKEEAEAVRDNPRVREQEQLTSILEPLGLVIKDIHPDGHW